MINCIKIDDVNIDDKSIFEATSSGEIHEFLEVESGEKKLQNTKFCVTYSDKFLYLNYDCIDSVIVSNFDGYNDPLYTEDAVELFISPSGDCRTYLEYEVSPKNTQFLLHCENDFVEVTGRKYADKFIGESVAKITENGYKVVMKLPLSEIGIDIEKSEKVMFNAFRVDNNNKEDLDLFALVPTRKRNFHLPKFFTELVFVK